MEANGRAPAPRHTAEAPGRGDTFGDAMPVNHNVDMVRIQKGSIMCRHEPLRMAGHCVFPAAHSTP